MVVCVCNAIRERDVRDAARRGAHSPAKAYRSLGCKAQCGQCIPFARQIIKAEHAIAC
jgi:bacterioferritin-associated ferredoxin